MQDADLSPQSFVATVCFRTFNETKVVVMATQRADKRKRSYGQEPDDMDFHEVNGNMVTAMNAAVSIADGEAQPADEGQKKRRNRRHLSCLPCARSKRKCSKDTPCLNCVLQKIECVYKHKDGSLQPMPQPDLPSKRSRQSRTSPTRSSSEDEIDEYSLVAGRAAQEVTDRPSTTEQYPFSSSSAYAAAANPVMGLSGSGQLPYVQHAKMSYPRQSSYADGSSVSQSFVTTGNSYSISPSPYSIPVIPPVPALSYGPSPNSTPSNVGSCSTVDSTDSHDVADSATSVESSAGDLTGKASKTEEADYVLKVAYGNQSVMSRYYGPSSGPSLLLWDRKQKCSVLRDEVKTYFPADVIIDLESILVVYYENLHWLISCFDWDDLKGWLKSENSPQCNAVIYMVLALGSYMMNNTAQADAFAESSRTAYDSDNNTYSNFSILLHLLRLYYLAFKGDLEKLWVQLSVAIQIATAMGYHRNWPVDSEKLDEKCLREYIKSRRQQSRIWYSLLEIERKTALFLGRPYLIRQELYDVTPTVSKEYNYETSFRDAVNLLVPIYTALLDEMLTQRVPSHKRLMVLDSRLSEWFFTLPEVFAVPPQPGELESNSFSERLQARQKIYLLIYKDFLRSRIHRLFLLSPNSLERAVAYDNFFTANKEFSKWSLELINTQWSLGLHDLIGFALDNALFYASKMTADCYFCRQACAAETFVAMKSILKAFATRHPRLLQDSRSPLKFAENGLHLLEALEQYMRALMDDVYAKLLIGN
ncbi:uncharacterized protein V1510DRAFT_405936 [Dipodascopsis tothii]|uniref:uncharacterized protein n=1 Tax=Dipodascopsis tothii TaxID=44089 RepID=UPI0034CF793D